MIRQIVSAITLLMLTEVAASQTFSVKSYITFSDSDLVRNKKQRDACLQIANELQSYLKDPVVSDLLNVGEDGISSSDVANVSQYLRDLSKMFEKIVELNPGCPNNGLVGRITLDNFAKEAIKLINAQKPKQESDRFATKKTENVRNRHEYFEEDFRPMIMTDRGFQVDEARYAQIKDSISSRKSYVSDFSPDAFRQIYDELLTLIAKSPFVPQKAAIESLKVNYYIKVGLGNDFDLVKALSLSKYHNKQCTFFFNNEVDEERRGALDIVIWLDNDFYVSTLGSKITPGPSPGLNFNWETPTVTDFPGSAAAYPLYEEHPKLLMELKPEQLSECSFSTDGTYEHLRLRFKMYTQTTKGERMLI